MFAAASLHPTIYYTRDRAAWWSLAAERVLWPAETREQLTSELEPQWGVAAEGVVLRPVGFRMLTYTAERAEVRLWWELTRPDADPVTVGAIVTVQWAAGDWWLWFLEGSMDMRQLDPARDSFIPWGPS